MFKLLRTVLLICVIAAGAYALMRFVVARPAPDHPWFEWARSQRQPLVFAHQGGEGIRPSNTLIAFDHAVAIGAEVLDGDVHMSKDGVLVLIHDDTVDRTTNGAGAIASLSMTQLTGLDAAHTFSTDGGATFPYRGQGAGIPTLESLFERHPDRYYGIEIKAPERAVAREFCALLRRRGMQYKVLVSSFTQDSMDAFREACPEVATSATQQEATIFVVLSKLYLEHVITPRYHSLQVPERRSGIDILDARFIEAARNRNLAVQPWTINSEADLRRIMALGVDGINTDFPDRLLALRAR
jgi:glycerophosphoryl diester phosphodiesterase